MNKDEWNRNGKRRHGEGKSTYTATLSSVPEAEGLMETLLKCIRRKARVKRGEGFLRGGIKTNSSVKLILFSCAHFLRSDTDLGSGEPDCLEIDTDTRESKI